MNLKKAFQKNKIKKPFKISSYEYKFKSGKYEGYTVEQLLDENPNHLKFLAESMYFEFSNEIYLDIIRRWEERIDNHE